MFVKCLEAWFLGQLVWSIVHVFYLEKALKMGEDHFPDATFETFHVTNNWVRMQLN